MSKQEKIWMPFAWNIPPGEVIRNSKLMRLGPMHSNVSPKPQKLPGLGITGSNNKDTHIYAGEYRINSDKTVDLLVTVIQSETYKESMQPAHQEVSKEVKATIPQCICGNKIAGGRCDDPICPTYTPWHIEPDGCKEHGLFMNELANCIGDKHRGFCIQCDKCMTCNKRGHTLEINDTFKKKLAAAR